MERLMYLKTSELNYSISSELAYETANESQLSLYYSMNNDSLDRTLEANIELNVPLIGLQNTVTATSNHSPSSNLPIEPCENIDKQLPITSIESKNCSEHLSSATRTSVDSTKTNVDLVISNTDSEAGLSTIITDADNHISVDSQLEVASTALNNETNQSSSSETVPMETQQDINEVVLLEKASNSTIDSPTVVTRGSKTRQTLVRFQSDEAGTFFPRKTTPDTQRRVLSSWNSLSRRSIFPKPILKKTSSVDQPTKKTIRLNANDAPKNLSRPQTRSSILRKSMPRKSIAGVASSSGLAQKEFITPKGNNVCDICSKAFLLKSTLMTHKLEHRDEKSLTNCKYCDRSFKKTIALSMHLKENCEKIPAAARKKLLNGEFNKLTK